MRIFISFVKITAFLLLSLITIPTQALCGVLFKKGKMAYVVQTTYYSAICSIFRIKVIVNGKIEQDKHLVFVGNHLSYIDIAVIGKTLPATFISKKEVASWPVLGLLAKVAGTIFIERTRDAAPRAIADIESSLMNGRSLILFPEGTSTKGIDVIPFKSTVFELFLDKKIKNNLSIQPFTITLNDINQRHLRSEQDQDFYAWYGDMTLVPHLWQLGKMKGASVLITMHPPRDALNYDNRKKLAADCHKDVLEGLKNTLPLTLDFKEKSA